ncbi:uncharacterized protein VP01_3710g1 [Puccinia sorghi]|uniref:Uncharacterized protein n=1 Tax=Puccinia sorghi TaxID=27349 RepID=A0A0L6UU29_9BASI|nr:uncharacterized protein VP01_3710g1 [Puccinia sorghi]
MSNSSQPSTILCPLPRRTHSNPIQTHHHHSNNTINERLKQATRNHAESNSLKLGQELATSDDVLSEFLSLFTPPSEPILIYNNHLDSSNNQSNNSSHSSSPVRTTSSTPLSSSSSSSTSPISKPTIHLAHHQSIDPVPIFPQPGLAVAPNHLSTIVSSPISRCHNPLPRHAELDVLASRLTKPLDPFQLDETHSPLNGDEKGLTPTQADSPLSSLIPALTLELSAISSGDS